MVDAVVGLSGVAAGLILPTAVRRAAGVDRLGLTGRSIIPSTDRFEPRSESPGPVIDDTYDRTGRRAGDPVESASDASPGAGADSGTGVVAELSREERQAVEELKQRDAEVRAHEQAHKSAGGDLAGGITFQYKRGPDGRKYAVGGEVAIDVSPVPGDPEATIAKMERVRRAALAPSNPSAQDRRVAAEASRIEQQARAGLQTGIDKPDGSDKANGEKDLSPAVFHVDQPSGKGGLIDVIA